MKEHVKHDVSCADPLLRFAGGGDYSLVSTVREELGTLIDRERPDKGHYQMEVKR